MSTKTLAINYACTTVSRHCKFDNCEKESYVVADLKSKVVVISHIHCNEYNDTSKPINPPDFSSTGKLFDYSIMNKFNANNGNETIHSILELLKQGFKIVFTGFGYGASLSQYYFFNLINNVAFDYSRYLNVENTCVFFVGFKTAIYSPIDFKLQFESVIETSDHFMVHFYKLNDRILCSKNFIFSQKYLIGKCYDIKTLDEITIDSATPLSKFSVDIGSKSVECPVFIPIENLEPFYLNLVLPVNIEYLTFAERQKQLGKYFFQTYILKNLTKTFKSFQVVIGEIKLGCFLATLLIQNHELFYKHVDYILSNSSNLVERLIRDNDLHFFNPELERIFHLPEIKFEQKSELFKFINDLSETQPWNDEIKTHSLPFFNCQEITEIKQSYTINDIDIIIAALPLYFTILVSKNDAMFAKSVSFVTQKVPIENGPISLTTEEPEPNFIFISGAMKSGKTTLFKALGGTPASFSHNTRDCSYITLKQNIVIVDIPTLDTLSTHRLLPFQLIMLPIASHVISVFNAGTVTGRLKVLSLNLKLSQKMSLFLTHVDEAENSNRAELSETKNLLNQRFPNVKTTFHSLTSEANQFYNLKSTVEIVKQIMATL